MYYPLCNSFNFSVKQVNNCFYVSDHRLLIQHISSTLQPLWLCPDRSPTCLKQKGMVSTLTPTMLFTTFMIKPQFDAVILKDSVTVFPSPNKYQKPRSRRTVISSSLTAPARGAGSGCVFQTPPQTSDVALCKITQACVSIFNFAGKKKHWTFL